MGECNGEECNGEQNVEGDADQYRIDGNGDKGVEMTNMVDVVFEDESDED